jgi:DNA-directed RNA polymerase subunit A'
MEVVREKIGKIEFKLISPSFMKKMAIIKVITPELYDADGYPVDGGLMDIRMGVVDPGLRCRTCGGRVKECPGHFGFIELARPAVHIRYVPWIMDFLRCTCKKCSRILISQDKLEVYTKKMKKIEKQKGELEKWAFIKSVTKKCRSISKCPHCSEKQSKIKLEKPTTFIEDRVRLTPIDVRERLERIPDEDLLFLGVDPLAGRPEWMIITLLPVPPVTVRPSITLESGQRSEDDLTHKLGDIVRTNQRLFENLNAGAPEIIIDDLWDLLQYHVTTFFANNVSQIPPARHRSGRPLKTLAERIKSKEGRFRRNLAGKRVDFSSRTVISPDPHIHINEVGIPKVVAMELTVPERVTEWNKDYLIQFVKRGPTKYPGANYVITPEGRRKRVIADTLDVILEEIKPGYVVERHLIDHDIVIFNRQPSLHKMSMMAHYVRVLPGKTFRINPCTTTPYNADFDGDEMNIHVPQTEEARAEAEMLMNVAAQVVTPRYGLPIIGSEQDHISGCYLLTHEDFKISSSEASEIMVSIGYMEKLPSKKIFTGKELFSLLLPKDFNYEGKTKSCKRHSECKGKDCDGDCYVLIENGQLKSGRVDDKGIGAGSGKLYHEFIKSYGVEEAVDFFQKVSLLGIKVLNKLGFTVKISDTDISPDAFNEIKSILNNAEAESYMLINKYDKRQMRAYPGRTLRETLESNVMNVLNRARNRVSKVVENHPSSKNYTRVMADSGARGSSLNVALIAACVGQTALRGSRITKGYDDRVLPHFQKNDLGPEAHGFIRHGYKGGLNPFEFFFHAISGRDSMMDTSMRTPKSGYMQRRLVNALQDLKLHFDGTVRDSSGTVVQFAYGEDGIDVTKSDGGKINIQDIKKEVTK